MVREDKPINEGSDVDVVLSFSDGETMDAFDYDEYSRTRIPVQLLDGSVINDRGHILDVRFEREPYSPFEPAVSLIEQDSER